MKQNFFQQINSCANYEELFTLIEKAGIDDLLTLDEKKDNILHKLILNSESEDKQALENKLYSLISLILNHECFENKQNKLRELINGENNNKETASFIALGKEYIKIFQLFLEKGANPNIRNINNLNCLNTAIQMADHYSNYGILCLLLKLSAFRLDFDDKTIDKFVSNCIREGKIDNIKLLLNNGHNPNYILDKSTSFGKVNLFKKESIDVFKLFLEYGADFNEENVGLYVMPDQYCKEKINLLNKVKNDRKIILEVINKSGHKIIEKDLSEKEKEALSDKVSVMNLIYSYYLWDNSEKFDVKKLIKFLSRTNPSLLHEEKRIINSDNAYHVDLPHLKKLAVIEKNSPYLRGEKFLDIEIITSYEDKINSERNNSEYTLVL